MEFIFLIQEVMKESFRVNASIHAIEQRIIDMAKTRVMHHLYGKVITVNGKTFEFKSASARYFLDDDDYYYSNIQDSIVYIDAYFFRQPDTLTDLQKKKLSQTLKQVVNNESFKKNEFYKELSWDVPLCKIVSGDIKLSLED